MELIKIFKVAIFDRKVMEEVANGGRTQNIVGVLVILLSAVAAAFLGGNLNALSGELSQNYGLSVVLIKLIGCLLVLLSSVISIFIFHVISDKLFGGKTTFSQLFRVTTYASIVGVLVVIPVMDSVVNVWRFALLLAIMKWVQQMKTGNMIGTFAVLVLIGFVGGFLLSISSFVGSI